MFRSHALSWLPADSIRMGMAQFLNQNDFRGSNLKDFLSENADRVNDHARTLAKKLGRPFQYLTAPTRKEDLVREMAAAYELSIRRTPTWLVPFFCGFRRFGIHRRQAHDLAARQDMAGHGALQGLEAHLGVV